MDILQGLEGLIDVFKLASWSLEEASICKFG